MQLHIKSYTCSVHTIQASPQRGDRPLPPPSGGQKPCNAQWSLQAGWGVHTFTEGGGGRVEALLQGGGGVHLDGGTALGAAHQGKVDALVHCPHNLQSGARLVLGMNLGIFRYKSRVGNRVK